MSIRQTNNLTQVASATMIGTAIEYFDNYIYAMAAVLVFNHQFFHQAKPAQHNCNKEAR